MKQHKHCVTSLSTGTWLNGCFSIHYVYISRGGECHLSGVGLEDPLDLLPLFIASLHQHRDDRVLVHILKSKKHKALSLQVTRSGVTCRPGGWGSGSNDTKQEWYLLLELMASSRNTTSFLGLKFG